MKDHIRREIVIFRDRYERRFGINLRSEDRREISVANRGAFTIFCRKVYPHEICTYEFLGEILNKHHATIIHYARYEDQKDANTKFSAFYRDAWKKLLTIHPIAKKAMYIERGALIGVNIN